MTSKIQSNEDRESLVRAMRAYILKPAQSIFRELAESYCPPLVRLLDKKIEQDDNKIEQDDHLVDEILTQYKKSA
tara:strand:- start:136 stop:360 length:225 start_codon:yes stop_codon:yes gene_type:complete